LTEHAPVTTELWEMHLNGERGIGIIPVRDDATVSWAAIDVDVYPLDLDELELKLVELKLPLVIFKTKSGGAHLYLFTREPIPARLARAKLHEWAIAIGYPGAEVFPKQNSLANKKDVGNWLNMPYFGAVKGTERYCHHDGRKLKLTEFIEFVETRRVSEAALKAFILESTRSDEFIDGPPCIQYLAGKGFPRGSRNVALFNLAVFARFAHGDDWKQKIDQYNRDLIEPPLSTDEVMTTLKSAGRKNYFFTCDKDPIASVCNKEVCRTRRFGIGGNSEANITPVMLGSLSKINSNPPMWVIDVEGYRIEVNTEDLINQQRFRKLCFEKVNKLPPLLKQPIWEAMIRERLNAVEVIEAPIDSGPEGQFMVHLENFCTSRVVANSLDEIILGKPYHDTEKNITYFRSSDLLRYLDQMHFRDFKEREIWAILRNLKAGHHQFTLKGKCVTAWSVPIMSKQTEEFGVPDMEQDGM